MSGIERGEPIMIDPAHPIHGGRMGIFEFVLEDRKTVVFSVPETEPKVFFVIRPDDHINYREMDEMRAAAEQATAAADRREFDPLATTIIDVF